MAKKRKSIGPKVRFEVFRRDGFTCQYCGNHPPAVILQLDHIIPVAKDGTDQLDNLITACTDCNNGKSDTDLRHVPPSLAQQIEEKKERVAQVESYNQFLLELRERELEQIKQLGLYWFNQYLTRKNTYVFGSDRVGSIRTFLQHLPSVEILEAIDIAHGRFRVINKDDTKTWKYFCGICWRKIRGAAGQGGAQAP